MDKVRAQTSTDHVGSGELRYAEARVLVIGMSATRAEQSVLILYFQRGTIG